MLSSLVDSALDLVSSLITFFAVRQALVPADREHRFGHGKAEALAGLAQAGFIAASGVGLLLAVGRRLLNPHPVQTRRSGWRSARCAIALTIGLVAFQTHVARRTGSIADQRGPRALPHRPREHAGGRDGDVPVGPARASR